MVEHVRLHRYRTRRAAVAAAIFAVMLGSPSRALAQDPWPAASVRVGGLIADVASQVGVNGSAGRVGTQIDLEDDLSFDANATTWFLDGVWRISRRNQIQVGFVALKRDVSHVRPDRTSTFHDQTFTIGSELDSFIDTWYLTVNYGFAFVATPTTELGVNIGFTGMRVKTGIDFSASGPAGDVSRELAESAEFTTPIPLPGVFLNMRPHRRVELNGALRVIKASVDNLDGSMWEARIGGDYKLTRSVGVGAAYYFNYSNLDRDGRLWDGGVEYNFNGPQFYAAFGF